MKNIGSIEIVKYRFDLINGQPKIIIEMIKLLDTDGKFIKFESMKESLNILSEYPVTFKKLL